MTAAGRQSGSDSNGGENSNNSRNKEKKVETVVPQGGEQQVLPQSNNQRTIQARPATRDRNKTGKHLPNKVNSNKANVNNGTITTVVRPVTISPNLKVKDLPKMTNRLKNRNLCLKGIILLFVANLLALATNS